MDTDACFGTKNTAFDVEHDQFYGRDAGAVGKTAGSPGAETTGTDLRAVVEADRCSACSREEPLGGWSGLLVAATPRIFNSLEV